MTLRVTPAEIVANAEASGQPGLLGVAPGWGRVRVGEVADITNGAAFSSTHFNLDRRGLPLIRIRDIRSNETATWYDGLSEPTHLVEPGALLVGMDGDFNAAIWRGPVGLLNQRVLRIKVDERVYDERFFFHALQGYLDAIWKATSSTTVKHLSSRSVADIPLPFPPVDEQRRIVDILEGHLSRLDAASASVATAGVRIRSLVAAGAAQQIRSLPPGTPMSTVGERATLVEYGSSAKASNEPEDGAVPVLRMGNVKNGALDWSKLKFLPKEHADSVRLRLEQGDLLFNRTNSAEHVGKCAVFESDSIATFASYLIRVRFDSTVLPGWANMVLNSPQGRSYVASVVSQQVGQANVNGTKLKSFPLPVPVIAEQERRLETHRRIVEAQMQTERELREVAARVHQLRRSLLAAAFAGRLTGRSSDLDLAEELAHA